MSSTCICELPLRYSPTQCYSKCLPVKSLTFAKEVTVRQKKINSPFCTSLQSFIDWNSIHVATRHANRRGKTLYFYLLPPKIKTSANPKTESNNNFPLHSRVFRFVKWKNDEWLWNLTATAVSRTIWLRVDLCYSCEIDGTHNPSLGRSPGGVARPGQVAATRSITFLITKIPEVINFACIT